MSTRNLTYFHERKDGPPFACVSTKGEIWEYGSALARILRPMRVKHGGTLPPDDVHANGMGELAARVIVKLDVAGEASALVPLEAAERVRPVQDWVYHVWPEAAVDTLEIGVSVPVGVTMMHVDSRRVHVDDIVDEDLLL